MDLKLSYWQSHAVTVVAVDPAAPTLQSPETPVDNTGTIVTYAAIAIIIAVAIVGAIIILIVRK